MNIITMQVGVIGTNCYLLCDEASKKCAVVDPGGDAPRICAEMERIGCTPVCVLLTHGHYDHTNGVEGLREKFPDLPIYLNSRDVFREADRTTAYLYPTLSNVTNYDEGDTVSVGTLSVDVLATPGHSKGSVTLVCGSALFCGDTLFAGSCGRTDLPGGDVEGILASLARLGRLEGDYQVLPGHMGASTMARERAENPYLLQALRG